MAFDGLNYSTENMDNESIQDKIDALNASVKNSLSALKKETLITSLNSGVVDIKDAWSFLFFRDKNGVEIWRLNDNTSITILKDHIFWENNKVFLHARLNDGKIGYVSADFIKAVTQSSPAWARSTPSNKSKPAQRPTQRLNPRPRPDLNLSPETWSTPELEVNILEEVPYTNAAIFRDGIPYLIQPDGSEIPMDYPQTPSLNSQYPWMIEYLTIWKEAASEEARDMLAKWSTSDDELIQSSVNEIWRLETQLAELILEIPRNIQWEGEIIEEIFSTINRAEGNGNLSQWETILSNNQEIEAILLNPNISPKEKRLSVMRLSREGFLDHGNSHRVQSMLADQMLASWEFIEINTLLEDPQLINLAKGGERNTQALADMLESSGINLENGFYEHDAMSLAEYFIDQAGEISRRLQKEENREYLQSVLAEVNPQRVAAGEAELSLNDLVEHQENIALVEYAKHLLFRTSIMQMEHRGNQDTTLTGMYADIVWLAENRGSIRDSFDIADSSIDWIIEWSAFAITTIATMGAWAAVVGVATALRASLLAKTWYSTTRFATSTNWAVRWARTWLSIAWEWLAFHAGLTLANNALYQEEFSWMLNGMMNWESIAHSIIGLWVFRFFSYLRAGWQIPGTSFFPSARVPAGILWKWILIWAEAGAITFATEGSNSIFFDEEFTPTWQEYFQALIFTGLFRWHEAYRWGNLRINKNWNGELILLESPSALVSRYVKEWRSALTGERIPSAPSSQHPRNNRNLTTPRKSEPSTSTERIPQETVQRNMWLWRNERLVEAERLLWNNLSKAQQNAIMRAHNTTGVNAKARILSERLPDWSQIFNINQRGILMRNGITGRPEITNNTQPVSPNTWSTLFRSPAFWNFANNRSIQNTLRWKLNKWEGAIMLAKPITGPVNIVSNITRWMISHPTQIVNNISSAPWIPASIKEAILSVFVSPNHANQWFIRNMLSFAISWAVPATISLADYGVTWNFDNVNGVNTLGADVAENFFMYNVLGWKIALGKELYEQWIIEIWWDIWNAMEVAAEARE